jgi:copper chaperone
MKLMTLQLTVPNMACSACGDTITKAVKAVDPTAMIQADPKTKLVSIETQQSETAIKQAITDAGYTVA